jgi:hypothetical protein
MTDGGESAYHTPPGKVACPKNALKSVPLKNCKKVQFFRMRRQTMYMEKLQINPCQVALGNTICFKTLFKVHLFRTALQDFNVSAHSSRIA